MTQTRTRTKTACPMAGGTGETPSPAGQQRRTVDWMQTQSCILDVWLDQLIAEGDPNDLVTMLHRQKAWLEMMQLRLGESSEDEAHQGFPGAQGAPQSPA